MSKRGKKLERDVGAFMPQYGRKKRTGANSNDRQYDRRVEKKIKRMDPEELARVLHGDADDEDSETGATSEKDDT